MDMGDFQLNAAVQSATSERDEVIERGESPTMIEFQTIDARGNSNDKMKRAPSSNMLGPSLSSKLQKIERNHKVRR
jgi:hypothetical protein